MSGFPLLLDVTARRVLVVGGEQWLRAALLGWPKPLRRSRVVAL